MAAEDACGELNVRLRATDGREILLTDAGILGIMSLGNHCAGDDNLIREALKVGLRFRIGGDAVNRLLSA